MPRKIKSSIEERVLQQQKNKILENIKIINDLCFKPNVQITQEMIEQIRKSIGRDSKFIVAKRYVDVDVFPYNDAYIESRDSAIENSKKKYPGDSYFNKGFDIYNYSLNEGTCFITNRSYFGDRILGHNLLESGYEKQVYFDAVCIPSSAATLCFRKSFNNESYKTDKEISLEEYIKTKIENEIRLAERVKNNSRYAGNIDSKIEMLNQKLKMVHSMAYFQKETSEKQTDYNIKISAEQTSYRENRNLQNEINRKPERRISSSVSGIDSLINGATQRIRNNKGIGNHNVTKEKTMDREL